MDFVKMHGLGNDFVVLDCLGGPAPDAPGELAKRVCARRFSVGADGLALILPSKTADARMRIFNPDGSEPEMCGNAVRCVAKYLFEAGHVQKEHMTLETLGGIKEMRVYAEGNTVARVRVDMGIPLALGEAEFQIAGKKATFALVSMGNPHAVTYCVNPTDEIFNEYGPFLERHPRFPEGTNVEFCTFVGPDHIRVRVWERGAGPTLACGTGAAASFFAGVNAGRIGRRATVTLPGGDLEFALTDDGHVHMTGPAQLAYRGTL